ncbi:hypothetical protein EV421DRAFT_651406 [Armillaria borealis]|uniref:Uncharacterized protein n=1 Tax=Armillaria borealis TaxID=47425 RepID=A0AA39MZY2_9AGAR|nr:hypothetical protein EV421DRAFT_651406 [Armillaria borealis]
MYTASLTVILAASSGLYSDQCFLEGKEPESILHVYCLCTVITLDYATGPNIYGLIDTEMSRPGIAPQPPHRHSEVHG